MRLQDEIFLAGSFFLALIMQVAPASAEDILDIYESAVTNDPGYQSALLVFRARQEDPLISRSRLLPNISVNADGGINDDERIATEEFVTQGRDDWPSYGYGITLTQPVYDREKFQAYEQSKLIYQIAETEFRQTRMDLVQQVANTYLGILAAQDSLDFAIAEKEAISEQMELASDRFEAGLGTTTDLSEAKARFELAQAEEIQSQQALEDAHLVLWELIGRRPENLKKLQEDTPLRLPDPADQKAWIDRARQNNLSLIAAGLNEEVERRELLRQKAQRQPSLDLVVSYKVNSEDGSVGGGETDTYRMDARLQLSIPVFEGGGVSASIRSAAFKLQAAEQQSESALRSTSRDVQASYLGIVTSIREVAAYQQVVAASENSLMDQQEDYKAGLGTNLDVLNAQSELFQARRDYLGARYRYIINFLKLYNVAGELDVDDLKVVNAWLE